MSDAIVATLRETVRCQKAFFGAFVVGFGAAVALVACSASGAQDSSSGDIPGTSPDPTAPASGMPAGATAPNAGACKSCIQDSDCGSGSVCGQFAGDSFCAKICATGNECSAGTACMPVSGADGTQSSACIPRSDVCGPSVGPPSSDTLAIVGHTHTYGKTGPKQVTIGNGGAPLTGGANYGFGLVQQRADGAIQVDMIDSSTGAADTAFRFALNAYGSPAP